MCFSVIVFVSLSHSHKSLDDLHISERKICEWTVDSGNSTIHRRDTEAQAKRKSLCLRVSVVNQTSNCLCVEMEAHRRIVIRVSKSAGESGRKSGQKEIAEDMMPKVR